MNQFKALWVAVIAASVLASCDGTKNTEPGMPITAEQFEKVPQDAANNGKRMSITGYCYLSATDVQINNNKIAVMLYNQPKGEGGFIASFLVDFKAAKNGANMPETFTPDDLTLTDNEGNKLTVNDKVTLSFTANLQTDRATIEKTKTVKDAAGNDSEVKVKEYYHDFSDIRIDRAK